MAGPDPIDELINSALGGGGGAGGGIVIGSGSINVGDNQYRVNPNTGNYERVSRGGDLTLEEQLLLRRTPSQSSSYNVSQSYSDPASLALQQRGLDQERDLTLAKLGQDRELTLADLAQQDRQFLASLQQDHSQFMQSLQLERAALEQRVYEFDQSFALEQANLQFLQDKFAFESQHASKELALATQTAMFNQRATVAQMETERTAMIQQVRNLNVQMQAENQRFNAQMKFAVDQANQQAEERRQDRLQALATNIGQLAQDPGDRGALAAYVLANQGEGFADVTDQDLRTEASLTPLDMLLTQREEAMKPQTPFSYEEQVAPQIAEPTFGALPQVSDFSQVLQATQPFQATPFQAPERRDMSGVLGGPVHEPEYAQTPFGKTIPTSPAPDRSVITSLPVGGSMVGDNGFTYTNYGTSNGALSALSPDAYTQVPEWVKKQTGARYEEGGIATEGVYVAGDSSDGKENEEAIIKLADGIDLVVPKSKVSPEQWKRITSGKLRMEDGGVFASIFGPATPNTTRARPFLDEASRRARAGTPWETGDLPGTTFASTPGMDPAVIELLASINSIERGIPQDFFQRQAQRATPFGIAPGVVRRAA